MALFVCKHFIVDETVLQYIIYRCQDPSESDAPTPAGVGTRRNPTPTPS